MNEEEQKQKRRNRKNKKDRKKWIVPLLILILLILGIVILIMLLQHGNHVENFVEIIVSTETSGDGVGLVIEPSADGGRFSKRGNTLEQDVAISGQRSMTIPANKKEVAVDFYNPEENEGAYYLSFELRLYDGSEPGYEVLYASGLVEPGKHIDRIELSRALEKGVYDAVVHIQPYRMNKEKTLTNNADIKISLVVV